MKRTNIILNENEYEYLRLWAYKNKSSASYLIRYLIGLASKQLITKAYIEQVSCEESKQKKGGKNERNKT